MARDLIRLFVEAPLGAGAVVELGEVQAGYLLKVMRLAAGDEIHVFNGFDGEHLARIAEAGRRSCRLEVVALVRPQAIGPDIDYLFAPLKRARLDYMVQKVTELGVRRLWPVLTERTQVDRINLERMRANAIEAAEQCGVLWVPEVLEPRSLADVLDAWEAGRPLIFADEKAPAASPLAALARLTPGPVAVLVGPEGGFSVAEQSRLRALPFVTPIWLGGRIMRADTAAVVALALVNATIGDWR